MQQCSSFGSSSMVPSWMSHGSTLIPIPWDCTSSRRWATSHAIQATPYSSLHVQLKMIIWAVAAPRSMPLLPLHPASCHHRRQALWRRVRRRQHLHVHPRSHVRRCYPIPPALAAKTQHRLLMSPTHLLQSMDPLAFPACGDARCQRQSTTAELRT